MSFCRFTFIILIAWYRYTLVPFINPEFIEISDIATILYILTFSICRKLSISLCNISDFILSCPILIFPTLLFYKICPTSSLSVISDLKILFCYYIMINVKCF